MPVWQLDLYTPTENYDAEENAMMNAKSKMKVLYADGIIEMNTTFAKMIQNPLSDEYALLQKTRTENPGFTVRRRQIKSNRKKDTYKGLTYEWMRNHIETHEPEKTRKTKLEEFDEKIYISQCHGKRLRYPTIKKWFLNQYPDVAKFGLEPEDEGNENNPATQGAIPFSASASNDVPEEIEKTA